MILDKKMATPKDKPGTVGHSVVETTHVVMPQHTNAIGTVFGGQMMSWIDVCAAVSAGRHCHGVAVTASFDDVHFVYPIRHGQIVTIKSQVNAVFNTSMEIGTTVIAENLVTGEKILAIKARSTFVALDCDGKPKKCPPLITLTPQEKQREEQAKTRKAIRLELRKNELNELVKP